MGIDLQPIDFLFKRDAWIALTGADFDARIDNKPIVCGWRYSIKAGQKLSLRGEIKACVLILLLIAALKVPLNEFCPLPVWPQVSVDSWPRIEAGDRLTRFSSST